MKKILALIFSVLMIASCFCFSTSAAGTLAMTKEASYTIPEGYSPIAITHVSDKDVYNYKSDDNTYSIVSDWSGMWGLLDSAQTAANVKAYEDLGTEWEIIGKFNATTVQKIAFRFAYASRIKDITVSFSKDNVTYEEVGKISISYTANGAGYAGCDIPEAYSSTEYQYIKLSKNAAGWVGFNSCVLLTQTANIKASKTAPENAQYQEATYVDGYCANASKLWDLNNCTTVDDKGTITTDCYSVARFANPVVISKIEFLTGTNGNRARDGKIYGSNDGENWDTLVTMPSAMGNDMTYVLSVITNKAYEYIRVASAMPWQYNWSAVQCRVYGFAETNDRAEVVSYESSPAGESANVWLDSNTTVHKGTDKDSVQEYTIAKLRFPTVVSDVYIAQTNESQRNRQLKIYGSVDGQEWVLLDANSRDNDKLFHNSTERHAINDTTAYNYIKLDSGGMGDWYWNVANVAVYGTPVYTSAVYGGAQTKLGTHETKGDVYSVRFLATIDEAAMENYRIGFEIVAAYEGGQQEFDITTSTAYSKVLAGTTEYAATDLQNGNGQEYICAVALKNISCTNYGDITFTVRTYTIAQKGAERVYGAEYTVVINDGVEVA